jgi:hypothetical protein
MRRFFPMLSLAAVLTCSASGQSLKQPDQILTHIFPSGAQQGQTVSVDLGGVAGLTGATGIVIDGAPGITVKDLKVVSPALVKATFVVAADAPVGKRLIRISGSSCGLTNSRPFFVGRLPELNEKEPNNTPETAHEVSHPVVVNARMDPAADTDCFAFRARAGQKVVAAVLAQGMDTLYRGYRMSGYLDTSLELLDDKGRVLAGAEDTFGLDPILNFAVPADGRYVVRVQSVFFKGAPMAAYRLTLGEVPYPTHVFPPGGKRGQKVVVNLGEHRQTVALSADAPAWHGVAFDHPLTDGRELAMVADDLPGRIEPKSRGRNDALPVTVPTVVNGRFDREGEEAWFRVQLKKGQSILLEVTAQRHLRSSMDSRLRVFDAAGKMLLENDDGRLFAHPNQCAHDFGSADSWASFLAPADGDYLICLNDQNSSHGAQAIYRLSVTEAKPDFHLSQWPDAVPIWGPGTTASFVVHLQHWGGLTSDVSLRVEGLPEGWTGSVVTIPHAYHGVFVPPLGVQSLMTITAPKNAKVGTLATFRVVGTAKQDGKVIERVAQPLTLYGSSHTDRMHLRFSPVSRAAVAPPLDSWLDTPVKEVTARIGETIKVPVHLHRSAGSKAEMGVTMDGPINGGAARCTWANPVPLKPDQDEIEIPLHISAERKPGVYGIVATRSWAADLRAGRPGPCTPIIRLTILPAK